MSLAKPILTPEQRAQHRRERSISVEEAKKAVYIDFEGFTDRSPSLVGVLIGGNFEQIALDPRLSLAAAHIGIKSFEAKSWAKSIVGFAESNGLRIIAFSSHEKAVFKAHFDISIDHVYADARMIAKQLRKHLNYEGNSPPRSLKEYLKAIDFPRGDYLGERKSTSRLKAVIDMLERRHSFEKLTPVVKAKWTKLLEHNRIDVIGMRELVLRSITLSPTNQRYALARGAS